MNPSARIVCSVLLVFGLVLPFLGKPVHVDDANFLALAEGAARDPWRPHAFELNWLGKSERAFDVLSNPPGIAWWLAPVRNAPEWALHAWMLPWLALALFGIARLARAFQVESVRALLVLGTSPVLVLSAQALTPDLPLFACALAGLGGFLTAERGAWRWALLAGAAVLFRYSGLCFVPLVLLAGFERHRFAHALAVVVPVLVLALHDLSAYGEVHALAMVGFQSVSNTPELLFRKLVAALAMLGGACMLPVLVWRRSAWPAALVGAALGLGASLYSHHTPAQMIPTILCAAAGGVSFAAFRWRGREDRLLAAWFFGGLVFLLTLQFMATRYWLPFLPAVALAALRREPSRAKSAVAVALATVLALGMSIDDFAFASAHKRAAQELAPRGPATFAGHWGWQYYLERAGWRALETRARELELLAVAKAPWPQHPAKGVCLEAAGGLVLPDHFFGPRVHTAHGAANFHAWSVSGDPIVETYAPWTLSDEPYDEILLLRRCAEER